MRGTTKGARGTKAPNRRGSPEAVEKRRAARLFNEVLGGGGSRGPLDGRTEKRRQRLLGELEAGATRSARELKPIDVLLRVQELLELGEPLGTIRKVAKVRRAIIDPDNLVEIVGRLHKAYGFRPEAYRFVGVDDALLRSAGVLPGDGPRRRIKKRAV